MTAAEPNEPCGSKCANFGACWFNGCAEAHKPEPDLAYRIGYAAGTVIVGACMVVAVFAVMAGAVELASRLVEVLI